MSLSPGALPGFGVDFPLPCRRWPPLTAGFGPSPASSSVGCPDIPAAEIPFCVLRQQQLSRQFNAMHCACLIKSRAWLLGSCRDRQAASACQQPPAVPCTYSDGAFSNPCSPGPLPATMSPSREPGNVLGREPGCRWLGRGRSASGSWLREGAVSGAAGAGGDPHTGVSPEPQAPRSSLPGGLSCAFLS